MATKTKNGVFLGGKGLSNDAGMHVPLIVSEVGVKPGTEVGDLVDSTDFFPTICRRWLQAVQLTW